MPSFIRDKTTPRNDGNITGYWHWLKGILDGSMARGPKKATSTLKRSFPIYPIVYFVSDCLGQSGGKNPGLRRL
jgi:hypothetical protein